MPDGKYQMSITTAIKKIVSFEDLTENEMTCVMKEIMTGTATESQIAGFLVALEMKTPSVIELTAAAKVMREFSEKISISSNENKTSPLIDIVGTGGDQLNTFNISTAAMFVIAAAGGKIAKHGNRSVSSRSGSADVLEHAGVNLNLTPSEVKKCIEEIGIGFLFAPTYHRATKHAAKPRKELGIRTFFNLLGPLTNPANADTLVVGVYAKKWLQLVAQVLSNLGCKRALVVHSQDGLDEISIAAQTDVIEVTNNQIISTSISPTDFGIPLQSLAAIQVESVAQSFDLIIQVLNDTPSTARDIVLLNAGAAIYIAKLADTLAQGVDIAVKMLASGKALDKFNEFVCYTQKFKGKPI